MLKSKQRAYLKSLASGEDTILIVGKSEIGDTLIKQANDALKSRELIKCKVLETCSLSVNEVANLLADKTNSEVVQTIGFKFVLYRKNKDKTKINLPK